MTTPFLLKLFFLLLGMIAIIVLTTRYRLPAFFALFIACFIVGLGIQLPFAAVLSAMKEGFGRIMSSLGLIIVMGTVLGILLEKTGCAGIMADFIMKKTGEKRASLAMLLTGFIVGLPVFCDSGYIVLSGLNRCLASRTRTPIVTTSVSLACGLYGVHCLVPPHPGAAAAAATIGVNIGKLILAGIAISIPGILAGHWWANYQGKKARQIEEMPVEEISIQNHAPSVLMAFLPVVAPILLIGLNSFFSISAKSGLTRIFSVLGEPVIALSVGIILLLPLMKRAQKNISHSLQEGAEKAGGILVIIGAGGAFGAVLAATKIGEQASQLMDLQTLGILVPFLLTFILKTAQGSSTVAIITASSLVLPLLPSLGLQGEHGKLIAVLAMGAGSMMISHGNDAYFWVISKFSGLEMRTMLRSYSVATILMGLVTLAMVYILSLLIL